MLSTPLWLRPLMVRALCTAGLAAARRYADAWAWSSLVSTLRKGDPSVVPVRLSGGLGRGQWSSGRGTGLFS